VLGGVRDEECAQALSAFFLARRATGGATDRV